MLTLSRSVDNNVVVTASELAVGDGAYFLFRFAHRATNEVVNTVVAKASNLSPNTDRYDQFTIPSVLFEDMPSGVYVYSVHEQASATNTDATLALRMVEYGWAKLIDEPAAAVAYDGAASTYKAYGE